MSWIRGDAVDQAHDAFAAAQIVILWRTPWNPALGAAVRLAREGGSAVVFDVDDLMLDPSLARVAVIDGIRSQGLTEDSVRGHYERIREAMLQADFCLAPTEELARWMRGAQKPCLVIPNGFDEDIFLTSRLALRRTRETSDGLLRIGYAGGSRTHQRDFYLASAAVADALRARPNCRLVLFRDAAGPLLNPSEFPVLDGLHDQIEWRDAVPLERLPDELARFDVSIAPLEPTNPYCEAKSELKFFEAALVEVPTIASPTGPFLRAIHSGLTGLIAHSIPDWSTALNQLLDDHELRGRIGRAAYDTVLWRYGSGRRLELVHLLLEQLRGGIAAERSMAAEIALNAAEGLVPTVPDYEILHRSDQLQRAEVTVMIPLYNYADFIVEALDSVANQSLPHLDLVVVDDCSSDHSAAVVLEWLQRNGRRFNRILLLRSAANVGLGLARNIGFAVAETPFVLPLDADNRLLPDCCAALLRRLHSSGSAYAYPVQRRFGDEHGLMGTAPYVPAQLIGGPFVDALALVRKAAWRTAGGYPPDRFGWEDFQLWCRMAERGLGGTHVDVTLAEYRVHARSMLRTSMAEEGAYVVLTDEMEKRHPWLSLVNGPLGRV